MMSLSEKLVYSMHRNFSMYNVDAEIGLLRKSLPDNFRGREVTDIGCGDGRISRKLIEVLDPQHFEGVDISESLVEAARDRGLEARVSNVEEEDIEGDLGVLWGVLHHFNRPVETLRKLDSNFNALLIREPTDEHRLFELGHRFGEDDVRKVFREAGIEDDCVTVVSDELDALFAFCVSEG